MKRLLVSLAIIVVGGLVIAGCSQPAATPPAPTAAAAGPAKAAGPTQAGVAPAPTAVPAKKVDFPEKGKSITIIVGVAAGGSADFTARLLAAGMEKELGTPVQVINKPGAGTQIAMTEGARAKPDGYTIAWTQLPSIQFLYLDPETKAVFSRKDFIPIADINWDNQVVAVSGKGPYKTLKDLIDAAKAKPGAITMMGSGEKGVSPSSVKTLEKAAGVKFAYVSANGTQEAATAIIGGHVESCMMGAGALMPYHKSGDLRYLGATSNKVSKFFPDLKTMESQGYKNDWNFSHGVSVPAGTPKEVVDILAAAVKKVVQNDEFVKKMDTQSLNVGYVGPAEYAAAWEKAELDVKAAMAK